MPATRLIPVDGVDARHDDPAYRWNTSKHLQGFLYIYFVHSTRARSRAAGEANILGGFGFWGECAQDVCGHFFGAVGFPRERA